jgi:hypothetical protein
MSVILFSSWWNTSALYSGTKQSKVSHHILCTAVYAVLHRALHRIRWDKAEVIHKEEKSITTEMEDLVMTTAADNRASLIAQEKNNLSTVLTDMTSDLLWWSGG